MLSTKKNNEFDTAEIEEIAAQVTAAIEISGKRLIDVAREAGITYGTIWAIMKGKTSPRGRTISRIAAALGTTSREIMTGRYDGKPKLVSAIREMQETWGPDAVKPGQTVLKREGDPCPVPMTPRLTDLIRLVADSLGVDDAVVVDHIQQMKAEKNKKG